MKNFRIGSKWFVMLLALSLLLAACGTPGGGNAAQSAKPSDPAAPKASTAPAQKAKWVHAVIKQKADAPFQQRMAMEKGYFDRLGIDFQLMEFDGDAIMLKALIAGEVDSLEAAPSSPLVAISQGSDLKFVGGTIPKLSQLLYTKNNIKTIEDIKGKNVGTSVPGSLPQVVIQALFYSKNIDINAATFTNAGNDADRVKALIAGKIDAAVAGIDYKAEVEKSGVAHSIAEIGEILPDYLRFVFTVTGATVKKRGDDLVKVLQATAEGQRYAIEHRDESLKLASKIIQIPADDPTLALVYDTHVNKKLLAPDMVFDPKAMKSVYELNKKLGRITTDFDVDQTIDLSFAKKAIANIGEYKWPSK